MHTQNRPSSDRSEIRTRATEVTGALNQRLRPLGHATLGKRESYPDIEMHPTKSTLKSVIAKVFLVHIHVYGHTMLNTPVLVRSLKLSNIGPS